MTKIIVVTSGKGGVGKTTTSAAFSAGLALRGHKTACPHAFRCRSWSDTAAPLSSFPLSRPHLPHGVHVARARGLPVLIFRSSNPPAPGWIFRFLGALLYA